MSDSGPDQQPGPGGAWFATTHWSVILAARDDQMPQAEEALSELCQTYWYPLYAFFRRQGCAAPDAEDMVQGFFQRLLARHYLEDVDRRKGKFRSFLLAAARHYFLDERKHASRQKRGGQARHLSLDVAMAENRYREEPSDPVTAETLFDRRWALTLLEETLNRLQQEYEDQGKGDLHAALQPFLLGEKEGATYAQVGQSLGLSEGAIKVAAHRMRARFQARLRDQVAQTVATPDQVDEEIDQLMAILRG